MCQFFSFVSDGNANLYYFNWQQRKKLLEKNPGDIEPDSHTSICYHYNLDEDTCNKYEYNFLTKEFKTDQLNTKNDSKRIKKLVVAIDPKSIVEPLNIHPVIHPFENIQTTRITDKHILLLKQWASVGDSVWDSVRASVRDSVWASVWDSVGASVGYSVGASVRASVGASVGYSVGASVRYSVWDSVWDSVDASIWAYIGSFFVLPKWKYVKHKRGEYPFQCVVDLWNEGILPSFDADNWYLHGKDGKILKTIKKEDL